MILKSDKYRFPVTSYQLPVASYRKQGTGNRKPVTYNLAKFIAYCLLPIVLLLSGCYSFKDVSIPPEIKTFRVNYIENRARYINPQLSPQLTDKLRQKINSQTRLTGVQTDEAHYDISGQITGYSVTTSAISNQQAAGQRLAVTVHINFKNTLDPSKNFEADVSRNFDFSAELTLTAAEAQLTDNIVKQMTDEIFNRIFSNW
jgi:outer membrane lipopolysaccharide assembly protein LptE/RlpB